MRNLRVKDYSDDDSTHTLEVITGITEHGCLVTNRDYTYVEEDTLEVKDGTEIVLEMLASPEVLNTLDELSDE